MERAYDQYKQRDSDILKNSFLQSLKGECSPLVSYRRVAVSLDFSLAPVQLRNPA